MSNRTCAITACTTVMRPDQRLRKGWCPKHYQRWKKFGSPELTSGGKAASGHETTCAYCGQGFIAKSSLAKYCSTQCSGLSTSDLTCYICGERMMKSRTSKPQGEAAHDKCRLSQHGANGYYRGCRCVVCTAGKTEQMREYAASRRERDGISLSGAYRRKVRGLDPFATVACVACGDPLKYLRTESTPNPMHGRCKRDAPAFYVPRAARLAIFERDGWTCQICMFPVDSTADYLDDWYPTLDHVVPQSHMLIPDHSEGNLRTACRYCNCLRGDGTALTDAEVAIRARERRQIKQEVAV
jgi:hypothetical protein